MEDYPRSASLPLADKVVAITGAAGGLGTAIARTASDLGAVVACLDLDAARVMTLASTIESAHAFECDVTDPGSVHAAVSLIEETLGGCDVLVNNAGVMSKAPLLDDSVENWRNALEVNLIGYFTCIKAFTPALAKRDGGAIVNIASIGASYPTIGAGAYCASKAGVVALTKQAALEFADHGIRVNAVSPGYMKTTMTLDRYAEAGVESQRAGAIPLGRIAPVEEVADVVCYLAGPGASYVTAQDVIVDGGFTQTVTLRAAQPTAPTQR